MSYASRGVARYLFDMVRCRGRWRQPKGTYSPGIPDYEEVKRREDRADWFRSPVMKGRVAALDMEFWARVDTGADMDVVSEQLLRRMMMTIEEEWISSREVRLANGATAVVYPDAEIAVITDVASKRVQLSSRQILTTNKHVVMEYELLDATESFQEWMAVTGSHTFLVIPNRTYDVILSTPWMAQYRVSLDFTTRRLVAQEGPSLRATDSLVL